MKVKKVYAELASRARSQGWELSQTRGNHIRWQSPDGPVVFGPLTPSDSRSVKNLTGQLRRAGLR